MDVVGNFQIQISPASCDRLCCRTASGVVDFNMLRSASLISSPHTAVGCHALQPATQQLTQDEVACGALASAGLPQQHDCQRPWGALQLGSEEPAAAGVGQQHQPQTHEPVPCIYPRAWPPLRCLCLGRPAAACWWRAEAAEGCLRGACPCRCPWPLAGARLPHCSGGCGGASGSQSSSGCSCSYHCVAAGSTARLTQVCVERAAGVHCGLHSGACLRATEGKISGRTSHLNTLDGINLLVVSKVLQKTSRAAWQPACPKKAIWTGK